MEQPGGHLRRLRGAVERAVVGEHLHPHPEQLAVLRGRDLAVHVVVAGERGAHQVLGAVLDPLHRRAGDDRADDRADVAGVDPDLVAEPAADVRGDHLDLVLGQPGDQRVDRAVRVRRLRGGVDRELAGDRVHAGDRAAGLHRRRVHARVEHVAGRRRRRPRRTRRRWPRRRRPPSRRCGCRCGPRGRRGSPGRRRRAPASRRRPGAAARSRPRSGRARRARRSGRRRRRTRPPGPGSGPCRWPARPARRATASASRPGPARPAVSPVITALTFGCASAALVSTERIRACAYGLRRIAPCSIPGSAMSSR